MSEYQKQIDNGRPAEKNDEESRGPGGESTLRTEMEGLSRWKISRIPSVGWPVPLPLTTIQEGDEGDVASTQRPQARIYANEYMRLTGGPRTGNFTSASFGVLNKEARVDRAIGVGVPERRDQGPSSVQGGSITEAHPHPGESSESGILETRDLDYESNGSENGPGEWTSSTDRNGDAQPANASGPMLALYQGTGSPHDHGSVRADTIALFHNSDATLSADGAETGFLTEAPPRSTPFGSVDGGVVVSEITNDTSQGALPRSDEIEAAVSQPAALVAAPGSETVNPVASGSEKPALAILELNGSENGPMFSGPMREVLALDQGTGSLDPTALTDITEPGTGVGIANDGHEHARVPANGQISTRVRTGTGIAPNSDATPKASSANGAKTGFLTETPPRSTLSGSVDGGVVASGEITDDTQRTSTGDATRSDENEAVVSQPVALVASPGSEPTLDLLVQSVAPGRNGDAQPANASGPMLALYQGTGSPHDHGSVRADTIALFHNSDATLSADGAETGFLTEAPPGSTPFGSVDGGVVASGEITDDTQRTSTGDATRSDGNEAVVSQPVALVAAPGSEPTLDLLVQSVAPGRNGDAQPTNAGGPMRGVLALGQGTGIALFPNSDETLNALPADGAETGFLTEAPPGSTPFGSVDGGVVASGEITDDTQRTSTGDATNIADRGAKSSGQRMGSRQTKSATKAPRRNPKGSKRLGGVPKPVAAPGSEVPFDPSVDDRPETITTPLFTLGSTQSTRAQGVDVPNPLMLAAAAISDAAGTNDGQSGFRHNGGFAEIAAQPATFGDTLNLLRVGTQIVKNLLGKQDAPEEDNDPKENNGPGRGHPRRRARQRLAKEPSVFFFNQTPNDRATEDAPTSPPRDPRIDPIPGDDDYLFGRLGKASYKRGVTNNRRRDGKRPNWRLWKPDRKKRPLHERQSLKNSRTIRQMRREAGSARTALFHAQQTSSDT
eukprot:jgi/Mesvir1/14037/Mv04448-RA.1